MGIAGNGDASLVWKGELAVADICVCISASFRGAFYFGLGDKLNSNIRN